MEDQLALDVVNSALPPLDTARCSHPDPPPAVAETAVHDGHVEDPTNAGTADANPGSDTIMVDLKWGEALDDFSAFLALCREARVDDELVARVAPALIDHYRQSREAREMAELEARWYASLDGEPDWSVYADDLYVADLWACWMVYSRKYLRSLQNDVIVDGGGSIFSDLSDLTVIADLGCGIGYTTASLKIMWPEATVIGTNLPDIRQTMIAQAVGAQYGFTVVSDLEDIGQADLVFASEYFEHFQRPVDHLRDVLRVLQPRALVVANTFGAKSTGHFDRYEIDGEVKDGRGTSSLFARTLRDAGYRKVATKLWNSRPGYWRRDSGVEPPAPAPASGSDSAPTPEVPKTFESTSMHGKVLETLRHAIPKLELHADKSNGQSYWIGKVNGKTVCYITGKEKVRIQSPNPKADPGVLICHPLQLEVAVQFVKGYVPEEAAT